MRTRVLMATLCAVLLGSCGTGTEEAAPDDEPPPAALDEGSGEHLTYQPDAIDWQDGPASLPAGTQFAVLEGDPAEAGPFTMRVKFPDGLSIPPHWHPGTERVTVLSGLFHLGSGEEFDRDAATRLDAGSYISLPAEMRHYAFAEGETIIQLNSIGPWGIEYVNPEDDPRGEQ